MLPAPHRLTHPGDFTRTVRAGKRAGSATLVVHLAGAERAGAGPRGGFVVSRAVGPAVTRNRVKRRLRALVAQRLDRLPGTADLVVRALPASASASYAALGADLDRCLTRAGAPADRA